jgi:hypothetical protein
VACNIAQFYRVEMLFINILSFFDKKCLHIDNGRVIMMTTEDLSSDSSSRER